VNESVIAEIKREHDQLQSYLARLNGDLFCARASEDCNNCPAEHLAECKGRFEHFYGHLLGFMLEHFQLEESAMRRLGMENRDLAGFFEEHKEAHANMMERLSQVLADNPVPAIGHRIMRRVIEDWFEVHLARHDAVLLAALRRQPF
jgi:hemerythrin